MTLRTSSYCIFVNLPNRPDRVLLVHGYTGAYDEVSRRVADFLVCNRSNLRHKPLYGDWSADLYEPQSPTPPLSSQVISELEGRGYLTDQTPDEELDLFRSVVRRMHPSAMRRQSYVIIPTYNCNLRCSYCFQDAMRTDPKYAHLLRKMSPHLVDRILKGIEQIEVEGSPAPRSFTFFGGEPLLATNVDIVEYIIHQASARVPSSFTAVTNGTDLDTYQHLLGPEVINSLQVTLDGPPRIHDSKRIYANGDGSFNRIANNITMALERGVALTVRVNVSRDTIEGVPDLVREAERRQWTQSSKFRIYAAIIHASNSLQANRDLFEKERKKLFATTGQLTEAIKAMRIKIPEMELVETSDDAIKRKALRLFRDPEFDPIQQFKTSFCGAHTGMWIFDPMGDIYACWERLGSPEIRIGRVDEDGTLRLAKHQLDLWRSRTVVSNPTCERCPYALNCGGGCAVMAEGLNGSLHSNYCDAFASRFKTAVATAYTQHTENLTC